MSEFTSVKGKVAIVNGCAQGIGAGAARKLAEEGCIVVMGDIKEKVKETFEEIKKDNPGLEGFAKVVDVSKEEDVKAIVEETVEKYGKLDIMYNNAGIHIETGNVYETPEETIDKILAVNFKGMFFGCKHAAKQMKKVFVLSAQALFLYTAQMPRPFITAALVANMATQLNVVMLLCS